MSQVWPPYSTVSCCFSTPEGQGDGDFAWEVMDQLLLLCMVGAMLLMRLQASNCAG